MTAAPDLAPSPALTMWTRAALADIEDCAPIYAAVAHLYQRTSEHSYTCVGCSTITDPDTDPSPGEADGFCSSCWDADHPDDDAS